LPDALLDFEDLMIFGLNYGLVGPRVVPLLPLPDEASELSLSLAERSASAGVVEFSLVLQGNVDEVKGLSVLVTYDPSELTFVSASLVEEPVSPLGDLFFWVGEVEGGVQLDLAVLGKDRTLGGSGEVAVLRFESLADAYSLGLDALKIRDTENRQLGAEVEDHESAPTIPARFHLHGAAPNPFRCWTAIEYDVPHKTLVSLRVYDVSGRLVRMLVDGVVEPGRHVVAWDGRSEAGETVGSGVYFCSMAVGDSRISEQKVILAR
jgi:hypothetical protein